MSPDPQRPCDFIVSYLYRVIKRIPTFAILRHLNAGVLDEAGVEIDACVQLIGFDPFVGGVGLRNVAWAEDDHLFHLS